MTLPSRFIPMPALWYILVLLVARLTISAPAQSNYGSIQGSVRDKSGALVPGATVVVTDVGTNEARTVKTNKQGEYSVLSLQPVVYRISITASGFKPETLESIKVDTAKSVTVDATLSVGTSEDVIVSAGAPLLQTEDGTSSFTIEQRTIQEMPLNGRNTLSLALTLPGASGNAGSEYGTVTSNSPIPGRELVINGGRPGTSQFVADGQNVTSIGLARTTVSFSPDTIQEFTVLESNFSAQYSQAGGAIIQQTTRGGSNDIHGVAYWFYRARHFQATPFDNYLNPVAGDPHSPLQRNQIGIAVGGPIVIPKVYNGKNKAFFFASYEPTRQNAGLITPTLERVPTAAEAAGNFCNSQVYKSNGTTTQYPLLYNHFVKAAGGALQYAPNPNYSTSKGPSGGNPEYQYNFSANIFDPNDSNSACVGRMLVDASGASYVNPAAAKLVALYPQANIPYITSGSNAGANYSYFRRATTIDNRYSVRIDKALPKNNSIFVRATIEPVFTSRFFRDVVGEPGTSDSSRAQQILLSETAVIRSNITNDVRIGYTGGDFSRNFPSNYQSTDGTTPYLGTGGTPNPLGYGIANFFNGAPPNGGAASWGGLGMNGIQNVGRDREHLYSASDDFNIIIGRHSFHAGVLATLQQANEADTGLGYLAGGKFGFTNATNNSQECTSGYNTISKPCATDNASGDPFAAFLEGVQTTLTFDDNIAPTYYYRWFSMGSYFQDDFKILPNLTINIGLRHQYQSPRWEKYNRQGQLNLNDTAINGDNGLPAPIFQFAGYSGRSRYLDPAQYFDFEPRFGFSWSPYFNTSRNNIVVRGGYGLTHDVLTGRSRTPFPDLGENPYSGFRAYNPESGNDGSFNYTNVQGCGYASCQDNLPGQFGYNNVQFLPDPSLFSVPANGEISPVATNTPNGQDARYAVTGVVFAKDFKTPYIQNFSLQIQTQLNRSTVLTVGWQGNKGTKLFSTPYDINNNPITRTVLIPGFDGGPGSNTADGNPGGPIILEDSTHSGSIYHALIANLEHRYTNGLQFDFNYTYSKSLDDSSGGIEPDFSAVGSQDSSAQTILGNLPQPSYGTTKERSVSVFDTPHVFNATAFYELPFGKGKQFLNQGHALDLIAGGWQLTTLAHITSGQPTFLTLGGTSSGLDSDRLNDFSTATSYAPFNRPNIVPGVPLKNPDWSPAVANTVPYLNPRAFTIQGPVQFGNAPRMISGLRLPITKQIDASIIKSIHPFENKQRYLELRGEFFNVLNWRTFGVSGVSTNLTNGNFNQNSYGQVNRYSALTPSVWDQYLKGQCSAVSVKSANGTVDSASTVCGELNSIYNSSFYILGQNSQNNTIAPRLIQVAAKLYF